MPLSSREDRVREERARMDALERGFEELRSALLAGCRPLLDHCAEKGIRLSERTRKELERGAALMDDARQLGLRARMDGDKSCR